MNTWSGAVFVMVVAPTLFTGMVMEAVRVCRWGVPWQDRIQVMALWALVLALGLRVLGL